MKLGEDSRQQDHGYFVGPRLHHHLLFQSLFLYFSKQSFSVRHVDALRLAAQSADGPLIIQDFSYRPLWIASGILYPLAFIILLLAIPNIGITYGSRYLAAEPIVAE